MSVTPATREVELEGSRSVDTWAKAPVLQAKSKRTWGEGQVALRFIQQVRVQSPVPLPAKKNNS
jgi:hypothetical protein